MPPLRAVSCATFSANSSGRTFASTPAAQQASIAAMSTSPHLMTGALLGQHVSAEPRCLCVENVAAFWAMVEIMSRVDLTLLVIQRLVV